MSFARRIWKNKDDPTLVNADPRIKAQELNRIEQGIVDVEAAVAAEVAARLDALASRDENIQIRERLRQQYYQELYIAPGQCAVALSFDDGPSVDYSIIYPLLRDLNIPASFAIIAGSPGVGSALTWAQIKEMRDHGMEMMCHSMTHATVANYTLDEYIAETSAAADILAAADGTFQLAVDTFVQPGTWSGPINFDDPTKIDLNPFAIPLRERFLVSSHYVSDETRNGATGLPKGRHYGTARGFNVTTKTLAQVKQAVAEARGKGALLSGGGHAGELSGIGGSGTGNTVAQLTAILQWLAAERDAGRIEFFTMTSGHHVRHSPDGRRPLVEPFGVDAAGNPLGFIKVAGAPTFNAGDAPSGGDSFTIHNDTDNVRLQLPAGQIRQMHVKYQAKNDAPGVASNVRIIVRTYDVTGNTQLQNTEWDSLSATPPTPYPTDNWQTYQFMCGIDPRAAFVEIWPYFGGGAGKVGAVRYADFEIVKT